jgi:hypothetical protein
MDRRRFLSSTMLSGLGVGLGLVLGARQTHAFTTVDCVRHAADAGCTELLRHKTLLADLDRDLAGRGVPEAKRKALEATAICPFCGELLIG